MDSHTPKFKVRLGLFIAGGLALFLIAVFLIGRKENLFNPVFIISAKFHNVSGLQVGNNIRFSGINIGTVDNISIINDSTVKVEMMIRKDVQQFIKTDCEVGIGSEGIIGDRVLNITQGSNDAPMIKAGQQILSNEPIETDAILASLMVTASFAEIITEELADIMTKINSGQGTIGRLIQDTSIAENVNRTIIGLRKSSESLDENMNAAKENFLLKGYFKRKEKEAAKKAEEAEEKKADELKEKEKK